MKVSLSTTTSWEGLILCLGIFALVQNNNLVTLEWCCSKLSACYRSEEKLTKWPLLSWWQLPDLPKLDLKQKIYVSFEIPIKKHSNTWNLRFRKSLFAELWGSKFLQKSHLWSEGLGFSVLMVKNCINALIFTSHASGWTELGISVLKSATLYFVQDPKFAQSAQCQKTFVIFKHTVCPNKRGLEEVSTKDQFPLFCFLHCCKDVEFTDLPVVQLSHQIVDRFRWSPFNLLRLNYLRPRISPP